MLFRKTPSPDYLLSDLKRLFEFGQKGIKQDVPAAEPSDMLGLLIYLHAFQMHVVVNFTKVSRHDGALLSFRAIPAIIESTEDTTDADHIMALVPVSQDYIRSIVGAGNWHPGIADSASAFHSFALQQNIGGPIPGGAFRSVCATLGFGLITTMKRDGFVRL